MKRDLYKKNMKEFVNPRRIHEDHQTLQIQIYQDR
jgi:hypothetical protein